MNYNNKITTEKPVTNAFELIAKMERYAPKPIFFLLRHTKNDTEAYRKIILYFEEHFTAFIEGIDAFACLCNVTNFSEDIVDELFEFAYQQNSWEYISILSQSPSLKSLYTIKALLQIAKTDEETLELIKNLVFNPNLPVETRNELKEWANTKYNEIPMELISELSDEEIAMYLPI